MRSPLVATALALLAAGAAGPAAADDSVRCAGGLVGVGDLKLDLLGKCGEPALREADRVDAVDLVQRVPGGAVRRSEASTVERWTYDFGRSRFVVVVTLEGGRVRSFEDGGRGYADPPAARRASLPLARCDYQDFHVGEVAYEVRARCGEPATRDARVRERAVAERIGATSIQRTVSVQVEIWTYQFGPRTLTRVLEIEDGRVLRIETGTYGYAP